MQLATTVGLALALCVCPAAMSSQEGATFGQQEGISMAIGRQHLPRNIKLSNVNLSAFTGDVDVVYTFLRTPTSEEYKTILAACPNERGGMQVSDYSITGAVLVGVQCELVLVLIPYVRLHILQRFRDLGTLRASLKTMVRYAPWIRRIHVVTNGNFPCWLRNGTGAEDPDAAKINLVTHAQIWDPAHRDADLPTHSSVAIQTQIHRINGLAEVSHSSH